MAGKGLEERGRREEEDPRVPQLHAASQKRFGLGQIGLFDKVPERLRHGREIRRGRRKLKPAIACLGSVGADAEGDDLSGGGGRRCGLNSLAEAGGIWDDMV